jgi:ATP-dependent Lon protease
MTQSYPVLPLRDIVVFPRMVVPLFVGRDKSVAALESAMEAGKEIFLVAQLDPAEDDPGRDDLFDMGVVATVMQLLKLPDGTVRVLVEGTHRATLADLDASGEFLTATINTIEERVADDAEIKALMRSVTDQFENYAKLNKKLPAEAAMQMSEIDNASWLADSIAGNLALKVSDNVAG